MGGPADPPVKQNVDFRPIHTFMDDESFSTRHENYEQQNYGAMEEIAQQGKPPRVFGPLLGSSPGSTSTDLR
jgi:hypothetical protein